MLRLKVERLKNEMEARGWNERELAKEAGIGRITVYYLLRGKRFPGSKVVAGLLKALPGLRFEDLFHSNSLQPEEEQSVFAFVLHPLSIEDVTKKYRIAKRVSPKIVASLLKRRPPFVLSEITGVESLTGAQTKGMFVVVPLLPWQIKELEEDYVVSRIVKACHVAEKAGARIVGLGAFTAIPGEGGKRIADEVEIAVTTGNTYTIATAIEGTVRAADYMGHKLPDSILTILGATGSIGQVCARILGPKVGEVRLVGRDTRKLESLAKELNADNVKIYTDVSLAVKEADLVIAVSSAEEVIVHPEDIKAGAVLCDVARPRDISPRVSQARNDVLVIDGGVVRVPGSNVDFNFDFGLPHGLAEACIAETMILALEKKFEDYTLGKSISLEKVKEISAMATKHGFKLAGFRRFEKAISDSELERIRENAEARRSNLSAS